MPKREYLFFYLIIGLRIFAIDFSSITPNLSSAILTKSFEPIYHCLVREFFIKSSVYDRFIVASVAKRATYFVEEIKQPGLMAVHLTTGKLNLLLKYEA